jgi:pimeloyl-ACP methyl ester carboxylesterase
MIGDTKQQRGDAVAGISRRGLLYGVASATVVAVAGGSYLYNLHQHIPPRDRAAEDRFRKAQEALLASSGGKIRSRFVSLAAPRMQAQVLEGGDGEPVLMLHGGGAFAAQMDPLMSRLSSGFHVYAPDRPGCGLSDMMSYAGVPLREHAVAFVGSVMDALGLKSANIVANSMGGYFGMVFAMAHPERVTRLITVGEPAGSAADAGKAQGPLAVRGLNGLMYSTVMKPSRKATYDSMKRILVAHPERVSEAMLDCCTASEQIPGAIESWLTLIEDATGPNGGQLTYGLRPELGKLTMPVLMVWGEKDFFNPPSVGYEMAAKMPNGKVLTIPDAGHLAWLDQLDPVESAIRSFLKG